VRGPDRGIRTLLIPVAALLLAGCAAGIPPAVPPASSPPTGDLRASITDAGDPRTEPVAVRIPAIGVDSPLDPLGIAADGTAEVPVDHARAGWFAGGGRSSATVLLGHVDSRSGPAVFFRLREVAPGDAVEVVRGGTVDRYVVERTEQVSKDAFPTFAVFGATADDVVRLVTCAGDFDRGARSYTDNLVVHARRG